MGTRGRTMKYFWVYLVIFFTAAFVLIYISSTSQMAVNQTTEQAQGVENRIVDLTKANEDLRKENDTLTADMNLKKQQITDFKEKNDILVKAAVYLENEQIEQAKALLDMINSTDGMTESQIALFRTLTEKVNAQ